MPPLTEARAKRLAPEQAAALLRVLDLQARWENHRNDPAISVADPVELRVRQKAFDAFQAALTGYAKTYRSDHFPEPTQKVPERLADWCRVLLAVFRHTDIPAVHVIAKAYRLADRIATRLGKETVRRGEIRELDAVIAWCDELVTSGAVKIRSGDTA